jgi:hypothetical protein
VNVTERFWAKVDKSGDCWQWTAALNSAGYGKFSVGSKQQLLAHRYAYELMVGPIPEGLELDHLCRVRRCVNPAHLEPVTTRENVMRGYARKTHCVHGHEYTPENTRLVHRANRPGPFRLCLACRRQRDRATRMRLG